MGRPILFHAKWWLFAVLPALVLKGSYDIIPETTFDNNPPIVLLHQNGVTYDDDDDDDKSSSRQRKTLPYNHLTGNTHANVTKVDAALPYFVIFTVLTNGAFDSRPCRGGRSIGCYPGVGGRCTYECASQSKIVDQAQ
jgi:hypothetical protein